MGWSAVVSTPAWYTVGAELMLLTSEGRYPLQNLATSLTLEGNGAISEGVDDQESREAGSPSPLGLSKSEVLRSVVGPR